jgi:uncharacterized small protein (DUF1192 family)
MPGQSPKNPVRSAATRRVRQIVEGSDADATPKVEPDASWYRAAELGSRIGARALARLVDMGIVQRAKDQAGVWRYDRAQFDAYAASSSRRSAAAQTEPQRRPHRRTKPREDDDDDDDNGEDDDNDNGAPEPAVFMSDQVASLREMVELLKVMLVQATKHTENAFALATGPAESHLKLLQDTNAAYATRCSDLETRHVGMLELFEKLLTMQHQRDLATKLAEASESRRDVAFQTLTKAAPQFFQQVMASMGGGTLLAGIEDDQLLVLSEAEVLLKPEQRAILRQEIERRAARKRAQQATANGAAEPASESKPS